MLVPWMAVTGAGSLPGDRPGPAGGRPPPSLPTGGVVGLTPTDGSGITGAIEGGCTVTAGGITFGCGSGVRGSGAGDGPTLTGAGRATLGAGVGGTGIVAPGTDGGGAADAAGIGGTWLAGAAGTLGGAIGSGFVGGGEPGVKAVWSGFVGGDAPGTGVPPGDGGTGWAGFGPAPLGEVGETVRTGILALAGTISEGPIGGN